MKSHYAKGETQYTLALDFSAPEENTPAQMEQRATEILSPQPARDATPTTAANLRGGGDLLSTVQVKSVEGAIEDAYNADHIAMAKPIRKPFAWKGGLMVVTSLGGRMGERSAEAYRIVPLDQFTETATTYNAKGKPDNFKSAQNDPSGFYHGMTVLHKRKQMVMVGPPICFVEDTTREAKA